MHVNMTKFERNSSLEYYHMTCIVKTNVQAKEVRDRARKSACKPAVAVLIRIRFAFAGVYFCFKMS